MTLNFQLKFPKTITILHCSIKFGKLIADCVVSVTHFDTIRCKKYADMWQAIFMMCWQCVMYCATNSNPFAAASDGYGLDYYISSCQDQCCCAQCVCSVCLVSVL